MSLQVSFSFPTDAEKQEFEALAKSKGLTLSQFVRWCLYRYSTQLENCKRIRKHDQIHILRCERKGERGDSTIRPLQEKVEGRGFFGSGRPISTDVSLPFSGKTKACFYCGRPANEREHTVPRAILRAMNDVGIGEIIRGRKLVVPACRECNGLLGSSYQQDLSKRKKYLKTRLRGKYKAILQMKGWTELELDEMDSTLRSHILAAIQQRRVIEARLSW